MSPPPRPSANNAGVKQRVNQCMTRLCDRDTEAMAASELESIAKSLAADSLPPFLSAISDTRPSDKTPLRRHSLRLLSLLSHSHPPSALLPLLPRMLAAALRRLRDPDSSVRSACIDAVRSMAATHPASVSAVLLHPLADALLHEQDQCAQMASAMCLAAAVEAASAGGGSDLAPHLQRLVPRLVKLARSNAFKAKPSLISLLGSIAGAGGASTGTLLGVLVPCLVEFLSSEDWAARKAAAEALSRVAVSERDLLGGFKSSCLTSFESRRFDKVKIVRDSMNHMVEVWKDIPVAVEDCSNVPPVSDSHSSLQSKTTIREIVGEDRRKAGSRSLTAGQSASIAVVENKKMLVSRSPPPDASPISTMRKNTPPTTGKKSRPHLTQKVKDPDWGIEIASPREVRSKVEARRALFEKNGEGKVDQLAGLKSASYETGTREIGNRQPSSEVSTAANELYGGKKETDLALIRMQLLQIEKQQSNLLDLLQRFIGSSQNGIQSLETRVNGLELALDEMSHDIALSSGRLPNNDSAAKTCCSLPGAEFLSPKFWRSQSRYSSKLAIRSNPKMFDMQHLVEDKSIESHNSDTRRLGLRGSFVVNPLAELNPQERGTTHTTDKVLMAVGSKHTQVGNKHREAAKVKW